MAKATKRMRVLIQRSYGESTLYRADDPESEGNAVMMWFNELDRLKYIPEPPPTVLIEKPKGHVQGCLCEPCKEAITSSSIFEARSVEQSDNTKRLAAARSGNVEAAFSLLKECSDVYKFEFEIVHEAEVTPHNSEKLNEFGPHNPCSILKVASNGYSELTQICSESGPKITVFAPDELTDVYIDAQYRKYSIVGKVNYTETWARKIKLGTELITVNVIEVCQRPLCINHESKYYRFNPKE